MNAKLSSTIGITSTVVLTLLLAASTPVFAQQDKNDEKQSQPKQEQKKNQQQHSQQQEQQKNQQQHAQQQEQQKNQQQHAQQQEQQKNQQQHAQQQEQQKNQQQHAQQQEQQKYQQQHSQQQEQQKNQQQHSQQQEQQKYQQQHSQQQEQQKNQQQHSQQQEQQKNQQQHAQQQEHNQQQQRVERSAWQQHSSKNWDSDHRNWSQRGGYHGYRIPEDRYYGHFGQGHGFRINGLPFLVVGGYPRFQYQGYWISLNDSWPGYWSNDWYDTDDVYVAYVDNGYYLYNRRYPTVGIAISISL
jgi:hypothetical protein